MTVAAVQEQVMEIEAALERIKSVVGPPGWIADPGEQEPYLVKARRLYRGPSGWSSVPPRPKMWRRWCGFAPRQRCRSCRKAAIPALSAAASRRKTGVISSLLWAA